MKKKLFFAAFLVLVAITFISCDKTCKTCKQVTYVNGTYESETSGTQYCGTELITIEATPDVTIGQTTTKWECN